MKKTNKALFFWLAMILPILALACSVSTIGVTPEAAPLTPRQPNLSIPTPVNSGVESQPQLPLSNANPNEYNPSLVDLYARVNPAVVNITIYLKLENEVIPEGQGSGFIYDDAGNIVTNAHVVHGSEEIEVAFSDGSISKANIVGEDLHSDIAVIKVDVLPQGAPSLPLGKIEDVKVGQEVIAIGNPFGLGGTLTRGVVSALGRTIPALTAFNIPQAIQTDAAINPGNSGGPLLNLNGEVIGINAQIETGGEERSNRGVGFAIPVNIVSRVVPELIKNGRYIWAWLGVRGGDLSPTMAKAMGLDVERGAYLSDIMPDGPSSKAGLHGSNNTKTYEGRTVPVGGDVIIAIDDQPVQSFDDLLIYVALQAGPGQEVTLTILRDGRPQQVSLTLEPRPESLNSEGTQP